MDLPLNAMTSRVRRTLVGAAHQAVLAGHHHIGTEHVLLALAQDPDGIAGNLLAELGVSEQVKARLAEILADMKSGGGVAGHPDDAVRVDLVSAAGSNHPLRLVDSEGAPDAT